MTASAVPFEFESIKITYQFPTTVKRYTPDFILRNGIIIETKGRFVAADRKKHLLIQAQYPEIDIRFVFQNMNQKLNKGSKTTYADWCVKNNLKFANKSIPKEWIDE